ncbi:MAG TPA: hypothetical protein VMU19_05790, partial [Bryobacteraceae bacterium]|nr:hypothetical protein [Bryobacteraceae bacterium]
MGDGSVCLSGGRVLCGGGGRNEAIFGFGGFDLFGPGGDEVVLVLGVRDVGAAEGLSEFDEA